MMNTSRLIFKDLYTVVVPDITLHSDEELKLLGIPITKELSPEQNVEASMTTCMLPISKMAEIYDSGFPVLVPNHEDTVKIYDAVSTHLAAWDRHLSTAINKKKAPTRDLLLLDEFADSLFNNVKDVIGKEEDSSFGVADKNYSTVGMNAAKRKNNYDPNIERNSLSSRFKSRVSINKIDFNML